MWGAASTTSALAQVATDLGIIIAAVVATLLTGYVALLGLGWGVRHFKKYISGKKF